MVGNEETMEVFNQKNGEEKGFQKLTKGAMMEL